MTIRYPRKHRLVPAEYADPANVFHLVLRAFVGLPPFTGPVGDALWRLVLNEVGRTSIVPLALCLMPDHLHIVCRPGNRAISAWTRDFKSYSTYVLAREGVSPPVWQPSFYDRLIRDAREYSAVIRYVVRNPVEAGNVTVPKEWPWAWVNDGDAWAWDE